MNIAKTLFKKIKNKIKRYRIEDDPNFRLAKINKYYGNDFMGEYSKYVEISKD